MAGYCLTAKTVVWETPHSFFSKLDEEFHFVLDVCALPENAKCPLYFTPEVDGLKQEWNQKSIWCNPPYGKQMSNWVKKAYESNKRYHNTIVLLLPARTDTKCFHEFIYHKAEIRFVKGRLKFGGAKTSAPFPSMVVIYK